MSEQQPQFHSPEQQWQATPPPDAIPPHDQVPVAPAPKKRRKWPWVVGGAVALVVIVANLASGGSDDTPADATPAPEVTTSEAVEEVTTEVDEVALEPEATTDEPEPEPTTDEPEPEPTTEEAEAEPDLTLAQRNAIQSARNYLDFMSFSRTGLIGQLEFEEYSTEDATFAVDYLDVDWNEQAAGKAEEYLDYMSFSRQGLIDQLLFEGFTQEQAEYGVTAVGY